MTTAAARVVTYRRVSTSEQHESGAGLAAQAATIAAEVDRRGWRVVAEQVDVASGKSLAGRDGLDSALERLDAGQADVLVVAKLDRLSRSLLDFAHLMERSRRRAWAVVALDLGVDTTTPAGEMIASLMATFAHYERRIIGQRTQEALAARRAAGVRLGRPPVLPAQVLNRLARERRSGASFRQIADGLNQDAVPTAHGGSAWHPATVRSALLRLEREVSA